MGLSIVFITSPVPSIVVVTTEVVSVIVSPTMVEVLSIPEDILFKVQAK